MYTKNKNNISVTLSIVMMLFVVFSIVSCQKENSLGNNHYGINSISKSGYRLPQFSNTFEVDSLLAIIDTMNTTEQITAFEQSKGYVSMGRASDELYDSINFEYLV